MKKSLLMVFGGAILLSSVAIETQSGLAANLPFKSNKEIATTKVAKGYKHKSDISGIRTIELDEEELAALGIRIANGNVYQSLAYGGYVCYTRTGTSFPELSKENRHSIKYLKPVLVTDDLGHWRSFKCQDIGQDEELLANAACSDEKAIAGKLNNLVPILVKTGQEYTFVDKVMGNWRPDVIFWYENTAELQQIMQPNW